MLLRSAPELHYPITVTALLKRPDDAVEKADTLFEYTYESDVTEGNKYGDTLTVRKKFPASVESPISGTVLQWKIRVGDIITDRGAELIEIDEPCRHEVQFGGLCANCGKDMTEVDYVTTVRDSERATINMTHGHTALTISAEEANRMNEEAKRRLLKGRKLSLVVDLDQTIIQAHVDKIIGDWMQDPENPNYDALEDIKTFQLVEDTPRSATYYVKMRPGLKDFLENISKIYECHVYTMGTRAYAQNIAKIVDPERKIFGDRILSRDESGSLTMKALKRLFPVDNKMVVIIDDRADVWNWSEHLIKVQPFEFFVGIGDINATFLPPKPVELVSKTLKAPPPPDSNEGYEGELQNATATNGSATPEIVNDSPAADDADGMQDANGSSSDIGEQLVAISGGDDPNLIQEQMKKHEQDIENIILNSPLARKQEAQDKQDEEEEKKKKELEQNGMEEFKGEHRKQRHAVLHDNDTELHYLEDSLRNVHRAFYEEYDRLMAGFQGGRVAELRPGKSPKKRPIDDLSFVPDVSDIMHMMKIDALKGCSIVFSGIFPQGVDPHSTDSGRNAKCFGAQVTPDLTKRTTHVVTQRDFRSTKVKRAARHGHIKIVTRQWLDSCFSGWKRVDEGPYLIEVKPDKHPDQGSAGDASPLEELEDGILYSAEDDDTGDTGDDLETPANGDGDGDGDGNEPAKELEQADWDEINAELEEFCGSDIDESDSEGALESGTMRSDGAETDADEANMSESAKKRKLAEIDPSDGEDSDASTASTTGSRLQRRKKRALERVTSLTNVVNAEKSPRKSESGLPSPETTGPEEGQDEQEANEQADGNDDGESDLEAEMMAALGEDDGEGEFGEG